MRFGDYIRALRRKLQWTQPDAAQKIGIEQSYLSKLESGKSFPSEDVFTSIKAVYNIDVDDLNAKLFPGEIDQLREISEVRTAILKSTRNDQKRVQFWLISGIVCLMIGGAFLGLSQLAQDGTLSKFQYRSEGVILEGESFDVFEIVGDGPFSGRPDSETLRTRQQNMIARLDEQFKAIDDYRGVTFLETVSNGTRVWRFYGNKTETIRSPLRWMIAPALMLIFGAFGCFFASYRSRSV